MPLHFVTMGQSHSHIVNGRMVGPNTVVVFDADNAEHGREKAFEYFGSKFCFEYPEHVWDPEWIEHYPLGYVHIERNHPKTDSLLTFKGESDGD